MDIKAEDFPLYQLLVAMHAGDQGVKNLIADFNKAVTGGDEENFSFAFGIQTLAANFPHCIPGQTAQMNQKTLQSCLAVFKDVASHGHKGAAYMVASFKARGLGGSGASPKNTNTFKPK